MRQVIKTSTALDRKGYQLVVDMYTGAYSSQIVDQTHPGLRYATEVVRVLGPQYSYAYVGIPVNTFGDEWAPSVALQRDGPAGKVKLRSRARVNMIDYNGKKIPLLVGYLVQYSHVLDEDSVIGIVMDDRWLLSKTTVFGAGIYNPRTKAYYFDAKRPCIFNFDGYPDAIDSPYGVMFAPSKLFGYKRSEAVEDTNEPIAGSAYERSRSWTCQDIANYLRRMYYTGQRPSHPMSYGKQQLSQYIEWPESFGNQRGFNRVARHFNCENMDVGEALGRICRKAGPYEIQMNPVGWRGQLGLVQVNSRFGGIILTGPRYGSDVVGGNINDAVQDSVRVSGGTVTESCVGFFDDVCIAGDPPALEHEFTSYSEGGTPVELENAWSQEEEDSFKKIINDNGKNEGAFLMACRAEPRVYCCYRIKTGYDAIKQTLFPNFVPPHNPRILPRLLSGFAQGNANPRDWNPREIVLEFKDEIIEPKGWKPCARFDNLEIIDDGNAFMVSSLREAGDRVTFRSTGYDPATYVASEMRITCAVEREFRITGKSRGDPNGTASRVNTGERFSFLAVAEDGDYSHWERYHSRPNGNNVSEPYKSELFPDRCASSSPDFLFSDLKDVSRFGSPRIQLHSDHRLEDVKRIDYHGVLSMHTWNPSLKPGMMVTLDIGGKPISPSAVIKSVRFNSQAQSQQIELQAGDNSVIYDIPIGPVPSTTGGAPVPSSATLPKTGPEMATDNYSTAIKVYTSANDTAYDTGQPNVENSITSSQSQKKANEDGREIVKLMEDGIRPPSQKSVTREGNTPYEQHQSIRSEDMSKIPANQAEFEEARKSKMEAEAEMRAITKEALRKSTLERVLNKTNYETE